MGLGSDRQVVVDVGRRVDMELRQGSCAPSAAFLHHCIRTSPWASHLPSPWFASPSISLGQE